MCQPYIEKIKLEIIGIEEEFLEITTFTIIPSLGQANYQRVR